MTRSIFFPPKFFRKFKIKMPGARRCGAFLLLWGAFLWVFSCAFFAFTEDVYANGNVSADELGGQPQIKKSVRKAPIRRPTKKKPRKGAEKLVMIEEAPPMPSPLEIGISLIEDGRYQQARPWLQKAVQEERYNPHAWYWYGMVHEKMGQFQQAQFFYARTLALDPGFPPFARVVAYPDEGDRKPLWDPLRPPRVYPVETVTRGVAIIPPSAPEATVRPPYPPIDPEIPKVPRYVPPEPVEFMIPGDALQPPVYVPPSAPEALGVPVEIEAVPIQAVPVQMEAVPIQTTPVQAGAVPVQAAPVQMEAVPVQAAPVQTGAVPVQAAQMSPHSVPPSAGQAPVYTPPAPSGVSAPQRVPVSSGGQPTLTETPVYTPPLPPVSAPAAQPSSGANDRK
jgi:hypothetical protein